jgi:hypothetical protein
MRFFHPMLLTYLGRKTVWPTLVGAAGLAIFELFPSAPLSGREALPAVIIVAHVAWVSWALARLDKGEMPFLYTRGFHWDVIWWHRVGAAAFSALVAITASSVVLWLGLRTAAQIGMGNSLYPLVARRESWVPMYWLVLYVLLLPVGLYAFVRAEHEAPLAGLWLAIAIGLTTWFAWNLPAGTAGWLLTALMAAGGCVVVTLLWAGQRLHRNVEVAS